MIWNDQYLPLSGPVVDTGPDKQYRAYQLTLTVRESFPYKHFRTGADGVCYRLSTDDVCCVVWFTCQKKYTTFRAGDSITAQFRVDKHREYNGVRESVAKYFKILKHESVTVRGGELPLLPS